AAPTPTASTSPSWCARLELQVLERRLGAHAALCLGRRDLGPLHATFLVVHEALVVARRRHPLVARAALECDEVVVAAIVPVGCDQVAVLPTWRDAVTVDLAGEA